MSLHHGWLAGWLVGCSDGCLDCSVSLHVYESFVPSPALLFLSCFSLLSGPTVRAVIHLKTCRCCCSVFQESREAAGRDTDTVIVLCIITSSLPDWASSLLFLSFTILIFLWISLLNLTVTWSELGLQCFVLTHLNLRDFSCWDRAALEHQASLCTLPHAPFLSSLLSLMSKLTLRFAGSVS